MHRFFILLLLGAGLLLTIISCREKETLVRIHTRMGDLRVRLYDITPQHRDNFLRLVREGFYDSLLFHRVIRDFMVQGGDPDSRNATPGQTLGLGTPGYELPAEIGAPHIRGALAAARLPDLYNAARKSNGSQFFIVHGRPQTDESLDSWQKRLNINYTPAIRARYRTIGGAPQLDGQYTVFGELVDGFEVLDRIAAVPRDASDRPLEDIRMFLEIDR